MMHGPLFLPASVSEHVPDIAVAVEKHGGNLHTAIVFLRSSSGLFVLDVTIEGLVRALPIKSEKHNFAWAIPAIDPALRDSVRVLCEKLADNPPVLFYGLRYHKSEFAVEGSTIRVSLAGDTVGVTCATFVLMIFDSLGLSLVDHDSWRPRPEDEPHMRNLADWAAKSVPPDRPYGIAAHVMKRNAADVKCFRFRPEEVLATCLLPDSRGCSLDDTESIGVNVRRWVIEAESLRKSRVLSAGP